MNPPNDLAKILPQDPDILSKPDFGALNYGINRAGYVIHSAIHKARDSSHVADGIREARRMLRMLTERESEIVDAIVAGSSSKQIAEALGVSVEQLARAASTSGAGSSTRAMD